jgi:hypothetical protein
MWQLINDERGQVRKEQKPHRTCTSPPRNSSDPIPKPNHKLVSRIQPAPDRTQISPKPPQPAQLDAVSNRFITKLETTRKLDAAARRALVVLIF